MLKRTLIVLTAAVLLRAQQTDKSVRDLADQKDAATAQLTDKIKVILGAEGILRTRVGPDMGSNPMAEAPFIHLRLMACLVKFDFSRQVIKIYGDAAEKAAQAAKEYESETGATKVSSPQATEARQQLEDALRRQAELDAKLTLNGVEKAELEGLPAFIQQLRNTIALYERIEQPGPAVGRAQDMARQLREKEQLFRLMAKQEDVNMKFFDAQCTDDYAQLVSIGEAERDKQLMAEYARLGAGAVALGAAGRGVSATSPPPAEHTADAEKLKEDERAWSDPDELTQRVEQLKQLKEQGKSK